MKTDSLKNSCNKKNYIYVKRKKAKQIERTNKQPTYLAEFSFAKGEELKKLVKYFIEECKQKQERDKEDKNNYISQDDFFNRNKKL